MVMRTMIRNTAFLSASHFIVRVLGFFMRIWLSRSMGAQAMGLVELSQSAQMLLITPVVSGLPATVSRMCAKNSPAYQARIVRCGMLLTLAVSLPIMAGALMIREGLALWLGDVRTIPALLVYLPCIPVLGISSVLNGYYYGTDRPAAPAISEIIEQVVRLLLCMRLVAALRGWPLMLRAAIPSAASLTGEAISLVFMLLLCSKFLFFERGTGSRRRILSEMLALALPLTGMRLVSSLMRTVNTTLIPLRLQAAGFSPAESLTQLGMMNGMMMPMLMLPSFVTGSLSMVCAPELTKRQAAGKPLHGLMQKMLSAATLIGAACTMAVYLFAPLIANTLYRQAELLPLLRRSCLLMPVMTLTQVSSGMMNALGLQSQSLRTALLSSFVSVLLIFGLCAQAHLQIYGAIIALAVGQILTLTLNLRALRRCCT